MKYGISLKIDVTKVDKTRLFQGKNGAQYLDCTVFLDPDNPGQYGDHGMITQDVSKEERASGGQGAILGNAKVFWQGQGQPQQPRQQAAPIDTPPQGDFDDIPF